MLLAKNHPKNLKEPQTPQLRALLRRDFVARMFTSGFLQFTATIAVAAANVLFSEGFPRYFAPVVVMIVASTVRLGTLVRVRAQKLHADSLYARSLLTGCLLAFSAAWAVVLAQVASQVDTIDGLNSLMILAACALAIGASTSLAASPLLLLSFLGIMYVPTLVALLFVGSKMALLLMAFATIFFGYCAIFGLSQLRVLTSLYKHQIESEQKHRNLQVLLDAVPGYVSMVDGTGRYVAVSRSLGDASGEGSTLVGKEVGRADPDSLVAQEIRRFLDSGKESSLVEMPLSRAFDSRWHLIAMRRLSREDGGAVVVAVDIHERRRAAEEAEMERARSQYSARLASLGEMATGIAHEINNPIAIISATAEVLATQLDAGQPVTPEQLGKSLGRIQKTIERLHKIIHGLRLFSRDGTKDPLEKVSVKGIVEEAVAVCFGKLRGAAVSISVKMPPTAPEVMGRSVHLGQCLVNLIGNAVDAVEGLVQERRLIEIEVSEVAGRVQIAVKDSGHGIPADVRAKLMSSFFTTKPPGKGTGLGLSMSRRMLEAQGGTLTLAPEGSLPEPWKTAFLIELTGQAESQTTPAQAA